MDIITVTPRPGSRYEIYSLDGKVLVSQREVPKSGSIKLSIAKGTYVFRLMFDNNEMFEKFLLE
jgi:hypothetical protein